MSTVGAYFRLARVGWVLVREGVISALPSEGLPALVGTAKAAAIGFIRNLSADVGPHGVTANALSLCAMNN